MSPTIRFVLYVLGLLAIGVALLIGAEVVTSPYGPAWLAGGLLLVFAAGVPVAPKRKAAPAP